MGYDINVLFSVHCLNRVTKRGTTLSTKIHALDTPTYFIKHYIYSKCLYDKPHPTKAFLMKLGGSETAITGEITIPSNDLSKTIINTSKYIITIKHMKHF